MPYSSVISRTEAAAHMPEDVGAELTKAVITESAALSLFRHITMSRAQQRMPVIAALPTAYFVNGDTGLKQTTDVSWANKYLDAEEVAAIVPIPEAVLDDTSFDVWGSVRPLLAEAAGRVIDGAIFFGTNKPASWPAAIVTAATAAGNNYERGTTTAANGGVAQDLSNLMALVEADGFDVNGIIASRAYRGLLRSQRATTGQTLPEVSSTSAYGVTITYPMRGMFTTAAELFLGDMSQGIVGIRQDWTYKVLDQAVIQDNLGAIQYNLAQQDMVALRIVGRFAWQVANVTNFDNSNDATRYPFSGYDEHHVTQGLTTRGGRVDCRVARPFTQLNPDNPGEKETRDA